MEKATDVTLRHLLDLLLMVEAVFLLLLLLVVCPPPPLTSTHSRQIYKEKKLLVI